MLKTLLLIISIMCSPFAFATITTVTDVLGRQVTFDAPAKRVIVGFYPEDYMAIGTESAYDHVVGMSKYIWQARKANWDMYVKHRPTLQDIPEIGRVDTNAFSLEKVISLNPDLILLANWQFKALTSEMARLKQMGVPVVVVDYNAQTIKRHVQSTRLIGVITGQQARAEQIAQEYQANADMITARLDKGVSRPKIYTEFSSDGVDNIGYTFGKNMWGAISTEAGGDNIAKPFVEWWGKLNPEQIIASNPDVIVITGYETSNADSGMKIGQGVEEAVSQHALAGFKQRLGWSSLTAVKNNRMYAVYHGACRTIMDGAMLQFYAKILYPDRFADLNPKQAYLDFYKKYLPVVPKGTFMTQLP